MKAYRILFAVLLAATLAQTAPIAAQEQEDHIVVRRRYAVTEEEKPDNTSPWYNNFTISLSGGKFSHSEIVGVSDPANGINLRDELVERDGPTLVFGFERLYRKDRYIFGPGIHIIKVGERVHLPSIDIYAHGQYELGGIGNFMGYNFSKLHPYAGASLGLSYLRYQNCYGYTRCKLEHYSQYYGYQNALYGPYLWGSEKKHNGIKPYADLDLGFTIDLASHMALSFSYHLTFMPLIYDYVDLNDHLEYIRSINTTWPDNYTNYYIDMEHSTRIALHQGMQISFRF